MAYFILITAYSVLANFMQLSGVIAQDVFMSHFGLRRCPFLQKSVLKCTIQRQHYKCSCKNSKLVNTFVFCNLNDKTFVQKARTSTRVWRVKTKDLGLEKIWDLRTLVASCFCQSVSITMKGCCWYIEFNTCFSGSNSTVRVRWQVNAGTILLFCKNGNFRLITQSNLNQEVQSIQATAGKLHVALLMYATMPKPSSGKRWLTSD